MAGIVFISNSLFFLVIHHANTTLSFREPRFAPSVWEPTEVVFKVSFLGCFCALCWNLFPGGELTHQSLSSVISLLSHVTSRLHLCSGSQGLRAIISSMYLFQVGEPAFLLTLPLKCGIDLHSVSFGPWLFDALVQLF